MKISTITCHSVYNYGAVLQAYALQKYLTDRGHEVNILDYVPDYLKRDKSIIKHILKQLLRFQDRYMGKKNFGAFSDKYLNLTDKTFSTIDELKNGADNYDLYITGSDQVWNMNMDNGKDPAYFLSFAPENRKKVSYAASMAMDSLNAEQEKRFKELLADYTAVSVRESSGVKLLKDAGIKCSHVCDPVYLLDSDEWSEIAIDKNYGEPYILVYAFYGQKDVYQYARKLAKEKQCKVYSVGAPFSGRFNDIDKYFWCVSPNEFINLIRNAECVVTNSFHGLSFSLIFNKPISVFKTKRKGNSRLIDMLKSIDSYEDNGEGLISHIDDYSEINKKLKERRALSEQFLERCGV